MAAPTEPAVEPVALPVEPGPLRVGGRIPVPPSVAMAAARPRSVPVPTGGYDRVGGSRLTGTGAVLLAVSIFVLASPPQAVDHELVTIVWATLVAVLVIGVVAPLVLVRRITVRAESPRDATVGDLVPVTVHLGGRSGAFEVRALDPTGPWQRASAPGGGMVEHLADRRGQFAAVRVEIRVTAPLGVLAAHQVHEVPLPSMIEVAPRSLPVTWLPGPAPIDDGAAHRPLPSSTGDLVRSVRPYVPGDAPNLVHWPSSARLGELVVRELEPPSPLGQAIVVDLRDLGSETEPAAAYALGACRSVLATGGALLLATCESTGPVLGPVRSVLDAGRRLARAVPGPPAPVPDGWPVVEIGR